MNSHTKLIYTGIITFMCILLLSGGAAAQGVSDTVTDETNNWCIASGITSGLGIADQPCTQENSTSPHQNVNISFIRSVHPDDGSVQQISPVVRTNTREAAELRIRINYSGDGNIKQVSTEGSELTEEDIEEADEVVENTLLYTYEIEEGSDFISDTYKIALPPSVNQVSQDDLTLEASVVSEDSGNSGEITAPIGGFTVSELASDETDDDETVDPEDEVSPSQEGTSVQDTDFDITLEQEFSGVSRFVDGLEEDRPLYAEDIPPRNFESGDQVSYAVGELINARNLRDVQQEQIEETDELVSEDAAIVTSQEHPNEFGQAIHFGTAIYGVPQSTQKELNITYALATERLDTPAEVKIVNAQGEEIDPSQDRTLENTMAEEINGEDIDFESNEQFQYTMDEDLLSVRSQTFELSAREIQYINNNYEAYVTYEVDGQSGLLIFRSGILSSDKRGQPIIYNPQNPRVNEQVQFETGILATTDEADFTWTKSNGAVLGEGKEISYDGFETSGEKTVTLTVDYEGEADEETYTESLYVAQSEFEDDPSTFNISYEVDHRKNDRFGTYDVEPEVEDLAIPVEITNDGDVQVERTVEIVDTFSREEGGYEEKVLKRETVTVPPKSTEERVFSLDWEAHEFGQHTIKVRDGTGDSIERSDSESQSTPVYVYQPATLEVKEQILPDSWLVENNFTARITVSNVGDLSTNHPASDAFVQSRFGDFWSSSIPEFDLAGGSVRDDTEGQSTTRKYDREGLRYSPRFPQVTVSQRQSVDSPFGTSKGTYNFESEVIHTYMRPVPELEEKYNETFTQEIELYKMKIIDLQLVQGKIDETPTEIDNTLGAEIYPSPFPYTAEHWTTEGEGLWDITDLQREQPRYDNNIIDYPGKSDKDVIPYSGIEAYHAPIYYDTINNTTDTEEEDQQKNKVYAKVTISNPGGDFTANARLKINAIINSPKYDSSESERIYYPQYWESYTEPNMDVIQDPDEFHTSSEFEVNPDTQPDGYWDTADFKPNVVSVAATDIEPYQDDQVIYMPLIIPNNAENIGEIEFTVRKRDDIDVGNAYIERLEDAEQDQFQERIQVRDFGDSFIQSIERNTETIDMLCSDANSNRADDDANLDPEGVVDQAGNVGEGNCVSSGESEINFNYLNRGSETVGIAPNLHFRNITSEEDASTTYHHKQRTLARSHVEDGLIINDFGLENGNNNTLQTQNLRNEADEFGINVKYLRDGSHVRNNLRNDEFNPLLTGKDSWWDGDDEGKPWRTTLEPGEEDTITFDHSFDIPGKYRIQLLDHRILSDQNADETDSLVSEFIETPNPSEVLSEYAVGQEGNAVDGIDVEEQIETQVTVLDSQEPSSRFTFLDGTETDRGPFRIYEEDFHSTDTDGVGEEAVPDTITSTGTIDRYVENNPVHDNFQKEVYNGLSSTPLDEDADGSADVIEGGAVKIDGQQRYYLHPEEARQGAGADNDVQVSSDNVGIGSYSWSGLEDLGNVISNNKGLALVRINDASVSGNEVSLTVEDTERFTNNNPNSDTKTKEITVQEDNEPPETDTTESTYEHNYDYNGSDNGEFSWAGKPTAEDDNSTRQDNPFTTVSAEVTSATDNGIGIEKGNWVHGDGEDTEEDEDTPNVNFLCQEFWPANDEPKNNDPDDKPGHEIDTINNELGNGACTGESTYVGEDFTGSTLPDNASQTDYTAIFDYRDRDAGTEDGKSYYVGFGGIDFVGNEAEADNIGVKEIPVYNDTQPPNTEINTDINNNDTSVDPANGDFWIKPDDYDTDFYDSIELDSCGIDDQGPEPPSASEGPGIGLHQNGDTAFEFTHDLGSSSAEGEFDKWIDCDMTVEKVTEDGEVTFTITGRDWYGNTKSKTKTLTGVEDTKDPIVNQGNTDVPDNYNDTIDIGSVSGDTLDASDHLSESDVDLTAKLEVESNGPDLESSGETGTPLDEGYVGDTDVNSGEFSVVGETDAPVPDDTWNNIGGCKKYGEYTDSDYRVAETSADIEYDVTDKHGNNLSGTKTATGEYKLEFEYSADCPDFNGHDVSKTSDKLEATVNFNDNFDSIPDPDSKPVWRIIDNDSPSNNISIYSDGSMGGSINRYSDVSESENISVSGDTLEINPEYFTSSGWTISIDSELKSEAEGGIVLDGCTFGTCNSFD